MERDRSPVDKSRLDRKPLPSELVYNPYEFHFVSQNRQNDFLKSLEQVQRKE